MTTDVRKTQGWLKRLRKGALIHLQLLLSTEVSEETLPTLKEALNHANWSKAMWEELKSWEDNHVTATELLETVQTKCKAGEAQLIHCK